MSNSYLAQMLEAPRMKSEERAKNKSRVEKEVAMFFVMKEILLYVLFGCVVIWICILEVPEDTHLFYNHIKGIMVDSRSYPFKVIIQNTPLLLYDSTVKYRTRHLISTEFWS